MRLSFEAWQTLAIILLPIAYSRLKPWWTSRNVRKKESANEGVKVSTTISRLRLLVYAIATAYISVQLLFMTPRSVFAAAGLPVTAPTATLVQNLVHRASTFPPSSDDTKALSTDSTLPVDMLLLIAKLKTLDGRLTYHRVGAYPLVNCDFCKNRLDFQLYLLPSLVLAYAIAACVNGILTTDNGRDRRRSWLSVGSLAGLAAEVYALFNDWSRDVFLPMYLHIGRYALFLTLITAAYFTSPPSLPEPLVVKHMAPFLEAMRQESARLSNSLSCLAICRAAIMRDPVLREVASVYWETIHTEAKIAKADPQVQKLAEDMGLDETLIKQESNAKPTRIIGVERSSVISWVEAELHTVSQVQQAQNMPNHNHSRDLRLKLKKSASSEEKRQNFSSRQQ